MEGWSYAHLLQFLGYLYNDRELGLCNLDAQPVLLKCRVTALRSQHLIDALNRHRTKHRPPSCRCVRLDELDY